MTETLPTPNEYLVTVNPDGDIETIQKDNLSIPVARGNRHYEEFLLVDTEAKLCPRQLGHEYTEDARWEVLRNKAENYLNESAWQLLEDAGLTETKKVSGKTSRQSVMDIKTNYPNIDDAEAAFEQLMKDKPVFRMWS